ncbi:hypothetical protein NDU88_003143 [Pleurodeles waltl]|uniref:Uncharacterized protein n=1 Tax=Pleurodeles waltl TaxID=8319 RepID=A0AAV7LKQ1_PLEWA|nr:hypothetical protein NDU88_003143 [Pleurodeles waltl]
MPRRKPHPRSGRFRGGPQRGRCCRSYYCRAPGVVVQLCMNWRPAWEPVVGGPLVGRPGIWIWAHRDEWHWTCWEVPNSPESEAVLRDTAYNGTLELED